MAVEKGAEDHCAQANRGIARGPRCGQHYICRRC